MTQVFDKEGNSIPVTVIEAASLFWNLLIHR